MLKKIGMACVAACLALAVVAIALDPGFAQTAPAATSTTTVTTSTPSAPGADTTINVGQIMSPYLQAFASAVLACLLALVGWITAIFNKKAGLESNAAVLQIEGHARDALQSALTNGAGKVVMLLGDKLNTITIDVKHPAVKSAILAVNAAAGEAIKRFGLSDDDLARMILSKVGVLTASNPAVSPTMPATSA